MVKDELVVLTRDDWDLTRKELRSQLVQLKLQIAVVEAGIRNCDEVIRDLP